MLRTTLESGTRVLPKLGFIKARGSSLATGFLPWSRLVRSIHYNSSRQLLRLGVLFTVALLLTGCVMKNGTPTATNNAPQATVSSSSLDFGSQDIGIVSNPLSITVTNTGGGDLTVSGIS